MNRRLFNAVLALFAVLLAACSTPMSLDTASPESTTVLRFDVRQGGWDVSSMAAVEVGDEWRQGDDVFRRTETGDVHVGSIAVEALAKADQTWSGVPSVPASNGWVRTFGEDVRHVRLNELKPGAQFVYGGRVFETRGSEAVEGIRATGEVIGRVLGAHHRIAPGVFDALVEHEDGTRETLTATYEHPFYVPALGDYVELGELQVGTVLLEAGGGEARLVAKVWQGEESEVFNFEVARTHNYFLRGLGSDAAGVLVHNCPGAIHVTPNGTALPSGVDVNLVPTSAGTKGDFMQIHQKHEHKGMGAESGIGAHTHKPEKHVSPDGVERTKRAESPTTAADIDAADAAVKDGTLRQRTSRKDNGDL